MHVVFKSRKKAGKIRILAVMPNLTTNQKIAIALSVPVAGVLFYFLLKWSREDDEFDEDGNYEEEEFVSTADLASELQIPQSHVGAVIGRGGSVIKQIQKESETRINFKDNDEESGDELTEEAKPQIRTMVIRGSRERIKHAEVLIKKIIDEQPVLQTVTVEVPQQVIGRVIGKGGKTIRQLCRISGAKIRINGENEIGEYRQCEITGTEIQIASAKQLIEEKISEDRLFRAKRKGSQEAKDKLIYARLPVHGDYFGVYVSAMDTPGHFWVQNVTTDAKLLDNLVEEMTQFYGDKGQGHRLVPLKVGDLCSATFQHDEAWYRAEVVQVFEERSEVQIYYLDFGDTGVVSMTNVKEIRKEFCDLPFQGIKVSLANIKAKGEHWSQEACEVFEKLSWCAQWKVLMARVVYYDQNGVPCIELIDTNTDEDVNIEKKLVEEGFAVYKQEQETSNPDVEDDLKVANSLQLFDPVVDQTVQKEIAVEQMNEQFQSPDPFENLSFEMNESESFEFPITSSDQDKAVVNEATVTAEEHQVVSCADISQLENLFGTLNIESSSTDDAETNENLIEETDLDQKVSKNTQEGSIFSEGYSSDNLNQELEGSSNFENPSQEFGLENREILSFSERTDDKEEQDNETTFNKHDPTADQVLMNLDARETVSEIPVTSSMNVQEMFIEPTTSVLFTEHVVPEITAEQQELFDPTTKILKSYNSDDISMNKDNFAIDHPITSTPEYHSNHQSEAISTSTPNQEENCGPLDNDFSRPDYDTHRVDYGLRRSYSEDFTNETLTDGNLNKSSSEMTVSPREDQKNQLSSRSLGSLSSAPPRGSKRVLAANFGQILSNAKQESDESDDGDSIYLSAKEDSDSTGFLSAVGSRSNLRFNDTDSDATPSGYLSEPEDDSDMVVDSETRLDTTLLVEKLEQYTEK